MWFTEEPCGQCRVVGATTVYTAMAIQVLTNHIPIKRKPHPGELELPKFIFSLRIVLNYQSIFINRMTSCFPRGRLEKPSYLATLFGALGLNSASGCTTMLSKTWHSVLLTDCKRKFFFTSSIASNIACMRYSN